MGGEGPSVRAGPAPPEAPVRAAELAGALSLATDLGSGQPLEHALRTAVLAAGLGRVVGLPEQVSSDAFHVALLHASGCTADGHEFAALFGDDIAPRAEFALLDTGEPAQIAAFLRRHAGAGRPAPERAAMVEFALQHGPALAREGFAMHCEVAQRFAVQLGMGAGVVAALAHTFERWDGLGLPGAAAGVAIPMPARLLHVARDASVVAAAQGIVAAGRILTQRAGGAYDPDLAAVLARELPELLAALDDSRIWEQTMEAEPRPWLWIAGRRVDAAFTAMSVFADLKSPWFRGHGVRVAELAEAAAWRLRLPAGAVTRVRRAGSVLDLGRVGVSNAVWEKPGPLGMGEWERVRLHAHFTERALAPAAALAPLGSLAGGHHERLDGSGYHRGSRAADIGIEARLVAAADVHEALLEDRPHRAAHGAAGAGDTLRAEARRGRLDPEAVDAVLQAAGHRVPARSATLPAGLTAREAQVLRLLVAGCTNATIADRLGISTKTAGHHVQHIYGKAGVRSRAAAVVWAFEQGLAHRG